MAKEKGKKVTLEEALVPVDEQPYVIPENWCWVKLEAIISVVTGKKDANYGSEDGEYTFFTCAGEPIRCDGFSFEGESLLLPGNGANVGQVFYYNGKFEAYQRTYVLQAKADNINLKYLYYQMLFAWNDANKDKQFGSATNYIKMGNFTNYDIPLPPLAEQQRIVEQIESLFSKLDEAKEKAQEVIDGYEARNAAVYNDAFFGRLTAQWRKDNYKENKWETKRFDEVADIKSNLVEPSNYLEFPHIAPDNIEKRTGILLDYHTIAEDGVKSGKHRFYAGQILYSKIRPYLSKVVMVDFDGLCSADMYPIEAKENTKYLLYYMLSDMFLEQASSAGSRSVLPKINQKELSAIKVRITSDEEQKEVVRILDYLLPMMQQVRDKAVQVVDNIDAIKKSILAKAFRGKLGTNIPEDESAMELLKIILNKGEC